MRATATLRLVSLIAAALLFGCAQQDASTSSIGASPSAARSASDATKPAAAAEGPLDGAACSDGCGETRDAPTEGAWPAHHDDASRADADAPPLLRVPPEQVCMRTNRFQNRLQLSIEVDGRTYFGCCAGCAKGLANDAATRTAKDPITGNPVDKAAAVIGARPNGSVVYFESEETFARAGGA